MRNRKQQRGQALVLLTLGVVSMFGLMGLAVDVGWMYYVRRSAQAAADAAALAGARQALRTMGQTAAPNCSTNVDCSASAVSCPGGFARSLAAACTYAQTNGFAPGARQRVTVAADAVANPAACVPNCIPTAPGVAPVYWVTVRISQDVPQLFAAVLGRTTGTVSARATAAVAGVGVEDSIIVTNRENDASPEQTGNNIYLSGGGGIDVPGGIRMASQADGPGKVWAGYTSGSETVTARSGNIRIRGNPAGPLTGVNDVTKWSPKPINRPDSQIFRDPFEGKGQPPIGSSVLPNCPVLDGKLPGNALLGPGNYYAVDSSGKATGLPLSADKGGSVRFTADNSGTAIDYSGGKATGTCQAGSLTSGRAFGGDHILYGGIDLSGSGGTMTVEPGRYVLAGTNYGKAKDAVLLNLGQNGTIVDLIGSATTPAASDPGTLFILTDAHYAGLSTQLATIPALSAIQSQLEYARVNLQGGKSSGGLQLHGLNDQNTAMKGVADANGVGSTLKDFAGVMFWQDQANSSVVYDASGHITGPINNPTKRTLTHPDVSPEFEYQGSTKSVLWGTIYQPRGAWMKLQGGPSSTGANRTRIVTGMLDLGGNSVVVFDSLSAPITIRVASLVE